MKKRAGRTTTTTLMCTSAFLTAMFWLLDVDRAAAQGPDVACYRITVANSPDAEGGDNADTGGNPTLAESPVPAKEETWCYRALSSPADATFIYNFDNGVVRPELSAIVERDGTLTHASRLTGELTVHRLKSNYNPLPVPLTPPPAAPKDDVSSRAPGMLEAADDVLSLLLREPATNEDISLQSEGDFSAFAKTDALPWRGYWWPYSSGKLHRGRGSPLAKYDRFVKARSGKNPGAQKWEKSHHKYTGIKWSGHCNGWAAAAILRPQPRTSLYDPASGTRFSISDLKGLLSEKDKCVKLAFFGRRYNGKRGDNLKDIHAREFHNTIRYYLGQLGKPIALDRIQGRGIDNNIISGYSMKIRRVGTRLFDVQTRLTIHRYDHGRINSPGVAPSYRKILKYRVWVDQDGQITKSRWLTSNPDFLWVPLAPNQCETSNPNVTEEWLQEILRL